MNMENKRYIAAHAMVLDFVSMTNLRIYVRSVEEKTFANTINTKITAKNAVAPPAVNPLGALRSPLIKSIMAIV